MLTRTTLYTGRCGCGRWIVSLSSRRFVAMKALHDLLRHRRIDRSTFNVPVPEVLK